MTFALSMLAIWLAFVVLICRAVAMCSRETPAPPAVAHPQQERRRA